jgi:hypothetical protein
MTSERDHLLPAPPQWEGGTDAAPTAAARDASPLHTRGSAAATDRLLDLRLDYGRGFLDTPQDDEAA